MNGSQKKEESEVVEVQNNACSLKWKQKIKSLKQSNFTELRENLKKLQLLRTDNSLAYFQQLKMADKELLKLHSYFSNTRVYPQVNSSVSPAVPKILMKSLTSKKIEQRKQGIGASL